MALAGGRARYSEEEKNFPKVILRATDPKWKFGSYLEHVNTSLHGSILPAVTRPSVPVQMI